jgi:hypothetical protein
LDDPGLDLGQAQIYERIREGIVAEMPTFPAESGGALNYMPWFQCPTVVGRPQR